MVPWLVAAAALLVYLITVNKWVTFGSLGRVATVSGLGWESPRVEPLYMLLTYPLHLLPAGLLPLGLNLFSVVCSVLVLALLARCVSLLPHDRTEAQRIRERGPQARLTIRMAWLSPVIAALVLGLQLTFWENATVASGEILNLLVFAYVVRCLLEFRVDGQDSWLYRSALVYGLGMTNNWAMGGFFPLFLVALVWMKGLAFFNLRFLTRMFLLGLAGLSLYLLLPAVGTFSGRGDAGFWELLRTNVGAQKFFLTTYVFSPRALFKGDHPLWVLALPSCCPCWP